jgi:hypothetical protein
MMSLFTEETVAKKAYRLLKDVPKECWGKGRVTNVLEKKCCFLGHYNRLLSKDPNDYSRANINSSGNPYLSDIALAAGKFLEQIHRTTAEPFQVNDTNCVNGYIQDHPKDRVMTLLQDMIKHGY